MDLILLLHVKIKIIYLTAGHGALKKTCLAAVHVDSNVFNVSGEAHCYSVVPDIPHHVHT